VLPSRWLADEMLGRLARYLRFVGLDTEYARGLSDADLVARLRTDGRFLLTRDRRLSAQVPESLLLLSPLVEEQWKALRHAFPELPTEVRFVRCSLCNGLLELAVLPPGGSAEEGVPTDRVREGLPLFRCTQCGHRYWEGSHTADIRRRIARWSEGTAS
jgi:uncharacterized protein